MDERLYWLGFSVFPGIGPSKFSSLLKNFGSAKDAWSARINDLKSVLGEKLSLEFDEFRNEFSIADYKKKLEKERVSFITLADNDYPSLLKQISRPPFVLYVKGDVEILNDVIASETSSSLRGVNEMNDEAISLRDRRAPLELAMTSQSTVGEARDDKKVIAVVGTRKITQYGRDVTELLTQELVSAGFTIVSGLALGVDAVAHQTAIDNNGKTIAVLGCGVDCVTPRENTAIYNSIIKNNGCIVSELPLGHMPTIGSFPARNRIIAGLSQGILVTEGAEDSGALITADYAIKFNRKVFAVPGPITSSLSKGPYKLIQKGAKLVTRSEDIINDLGITSITSTTSTTGKRKKGESKEEEKILEILENEPLHFDEIAKRSKLSSSQLGSMLSLMEIKGLIKSVDGGFFSIIS